MFRKLFARDLISKLRFTPPAPAADRAGIAILLMVKNEGRHIREWARFHMDAGAAHVIAYDDGSTDNTLSELHAVLGENLTVIPWQQRLTDAASGAELHNQVLAYGHALVNYGPKFRWMTAIDADEFLIPVKDRSLTEALTGLDHCGAISLPWHNFGRGGHKTPPAGGIVRNYTARVADPMSGKRGVTNFKNIVDPARVTALKVHSYEIDGRDLCWNDAGREFALKDRTGPDFYSTEAIQLNHYYTRSDEELQAKIALGPIQTPAAKRHRARVLRAVENIEADEVQDTRAIDYLNRIGAT